MSLKQSFVKKYGEEMFKTFLDEIKSSLTSVITSNAFLLFKAFLQGLNLLRTLSKSICSMNFKSYPAINTLILTCSLDVLNT